MEMPHYIYSILTSKRMIIWSWGFKNPKALPNDEGLIFHVNGFIHVGYVSVIYNEGKDLFCVVLTNDKREETKRFDDIYVDQLIEVIDEAVEHTTDYTERVDEFYNN